MPEFAGSVEVEIRANMERLEADLRRVRSRLNQFEGSTRGGKAALGGLQEETENAAAAFRNLAANLAIVQGPLGPLAGRFTAAASGLMRFGPAAIAGGVALTALALGAREALNAFQELEREEATIEGVLHATGNAAGRTMEDIQGLVTSIRQTTLATESSVRKAAAILLTFRSISGETFDAALRSAQDLSAVGFGSMESAATMLGKALEDPILGLTAMRRVGVTFSETQKQVIKDLIETGQKLEAMRVIQEGVDRQVGGVSVRQAQTLSGGYHQLSEAVSNFFEVLGARIAGLTNLNSALKSTAEYIDRVNKTLETPELETQIKDLEALVETARSIESPLLAGLEKQLEQLKGSVGEFANVWKQMEADLKTVGPTREMMQSLVDGFAAAKNALKDEREALNRGALETAQYEAKKKAFKVALDKITPAMAKELDAMAAENFYLKNGVQLQSKRISALGDLASSEERMNARRAELRRQRHDEGLRLTDQEIEAIVRREAAGVSAGKNEERATYGILTAQQARAQTLVELAKVEQTHTLSAQERANVLTVLEKKEKDLVESSAVAASRLPNLTRAAFDATDSFKLMDSALTSGIDKFASSITDVATNAKTLQDATRELAQSVVRDLTTMITKALLYRAVMSFLPGAGGAGAAAGGAGLLGGSIIPGILHAGGQAGHAPSSGRSVPAGVFAIAPRLHAGFNPTTEMPAILDRREEVGYPAQLARKYGGDSVTIAPTIQVSMPAGARPGDGERFGSEIGRVVTAVVRQEMINQRRSGGLLR